MPPAEPLLRHRTSIATRRNGASWGRRRGQGSRCGGNDDEREGGIDARRPAASAFFSTLAHFPFFLKTQNQKTSTTEGVLFAEKDFNLPEHPEIPGVPNLQVIKLMQSLKSKEHVTERFAWRHYYWFLTDEGIEHLRGVLNLPAEIVPATLKKSTRPLERDSRPERGERGDRPPRREGGGFGGDRGGYRGGDRGDRPSFGRGGGGGDKEVAPGAYRPSFGRGGGGAAPPS